MNEIEQKKYEGFFSDGMQVLGIAKQAQEKLDRIAATGFSVFDYFNERENDLSRVFAGLLDPSGAHGQGAVFLRLFLEETGLTEKYPDGDENWRVHLEYATDKGRRIDIVLNVADYWLGIENKPWAMEQENQVGDYLEFLRKKDKDKDAWICYFSGYGDEPKSVEGKDKDKCVTVPYRKTAQKPSVEGWIERSLYACEAEPVRWFLKDLLKYVRYGFFMQDVPRIDYKGDVMSKTVADFIIERARNNPADFEMAFAVEKAMLDVRKKLILCFIEKIRTQIEENKKPWKCKMVKENECMDKYAWILLYKEGWELKERNIELGRRPAVGVFLHTENVRWEDVRLYVSAPDAYEYKHFQKLLCTKLKEAQPSARHHNYPPSPVVARLPDDTCNWNKDEFLEKIINEEQADCIAKEIAEQMCKAVEAVEITLDELMKQRNSS